MGRILCLLLITVMLQNICRGKVFIEPFAGYQTDLNHTNTRLINSGVQLAIKKKRYEFLLQVQKSWPEPVYSHDSAFTLNPNLPLEAPATKALRTWLVSLAIGNRFKIAGRKTSNALFIKLYTGIMDQTTSIRYQYDKADYVILNPDQPLSHAGIYISGGMEYMRQFRQGRLLLELNFSSPPSGIIDFPSSFNLIAPVSLNIGYSIQISK